MKKALLFLFTIITLLSCSNEDNNESNSTLNPPNWILGTWVVKTPYKTNISRTGFKFTDRDIIQISSVQELSISSNIELGRRTQKVTVDEDISENNYKAKITFETQGLSYVYDFRKKSDNEIYWVNGLSNLVLTKE